MEGTISILSKNIIHDMCLYGCILTAIWLVGYLVYSLYDEKKRRTAERERLERERQQKVSNLVDAFLRENNDTEPVILQLTKDTDEESSNREMTEWLRNSSTAFYTRAEIHLNDLKKKYQTALDRIKKCREAKEAVDALALASDETTRRAAENNRLARMETLNNALPNRIRLWWEKAQRVDARAKQWHQLPISTLMSERYGRPNEVVLARADALTRQGSANMGKMLDSFTGGSLENLLAQEVTQLPVLALAFSRITPPDPVSIDRCQEIWTDRVWNRSIDIIIADLYARKQIGGGGAVQSRVSELLNGAATIGGRYETLASALMWLEAYESEEDVLQYMLSNGVPMNDTVKERLHYLSSTSAAVSVLDAPNDSEVLAFDTTALGWNAEQLSGLFDNLVFQGKNLSYALAIRDDDKSLTIPTGFSYPSRQQLLETVERAFQKEFGNNAEVVGKKCIAMANMVREELDGLVARSFEHPQMALVTIVERIGSKLTIKFYTLFCPSGSTEEDRSAAASLSKQLNPKTTMWEQALKDTMLEGIQQALNSPGGTLDDITPDFF